MAGEITMSGPSWPFLLAMERQQIAIARANVAAANARRRIELLQRMAYRVPLHEWADALERGSAAVYLLLEAYTPGAAGGTPRCPPWATRRYRAYALVQGDRS